MSKLQWIECPSVSGSKPSFCLAFTEQGRRWVVWNHILRKYSVRGPQEVLSVLRTVERRGFQCRIYGYFSTQKEGKKFVEDGLAIGNGIEVD